MSDGIPQKGTQFDRNLNFGYPFTEQMLDRPDADAAIAAGGAIEVTPNDAGSALDRTYDATAIATLFGATSLAVPGLISLPRLPTTLVSITVGFNSSSGDGTNSQTGDGASEGDYATLTLSVHASAQGSASIMPDIQYVTKNPPRDDLPSIDYLFFLPGNVTQAQILTKVSALASATVLAMPLFAPQIVNLTLRGQQVSVSGSADAQQHADISKTNVSLTQTIGEGNSISTGGTTRFLQIPETIHSAITLSGTTATATAEAVAACSIAGGTNWPALSSAGGSIPTTVTGTVTPTTIAATSPAAIPTSGLYMVALVVDPFFAFGFSRIRSTVVDFSIFA